MSTVRPLKVVVAALGGQGGGVVCDWLVQVAHQEKHLIQVTSVPGVAQRTGATVYYIELFPRSALPADGRKPIMALMPQPGDVDVVLASEIMEAGRALQRGVVTPDRTTVIASSHRVYAIGEKIAMADGRADPERVIDRVRASAKQLVCFDMQAVAESTGSVISAAMLGGLAASGALPFAAESFRTAIRSSGVAVERSIAAFDAAMAAAQHGDVSPAPPAKPDRPRLPADLQARVVQLPAGIRDVVDEGVRRLIDYQDTDYARLYLKRLAPVLRLDPDAPADGLVAAVARCLALWMSFEDTIRVADLKIRASRARRVLEEVRAQPNQVVYVTEFMKPRVEEICGTMPAWLGRRVLASHSLRSLLARGTKGRQIATSKVGGFLLLYFMAGLRKQRRNTLRYAEEDARISQWLALITDVAARDAALAAEIAECQQLVKGYGDTHERGLRNFALVLANVRDWAGQDGAAARLRELRKAALADDEGRALGQALASAEYLTSKVNAGRTAA
jgi:indolepyruvate ferredoxin oxidoreductase, beta subunit